jgi:hypothetical protein
VRPSRALLACVVAAAAAWASPRPAAAADVNVRAQVLPQGRISDTSQIRLVISIDGNSIPEVTSPRLPAMTNLTIAGGPSTSRSSSYSFQNGQINQSNSITLTYFLMAKGPGPAEIPPFDVLIGGTAYRTQALRFQVEAGRGAPGGPAPPAPGQPQGRMDQEDQGDDEGNAEAADVFLQAKVGTTQLWTGQATVVDVTLYAAAPVNGFTWTDLPSMPGLWVEELPVDPNRERRVVPMNGRDYVAYPVARKLIVPTGSGTVTIPSFPAQVQVRRSPRDPFGAFFSLGGFVNLVRKTNALKLEVKPLPEAGRPAEFSGAVGSYRMNVVLDRPSVDVGDAVSVRATIEGTGSLQAAAPPRLTAPPDVKIYEPKVVGESATGPDHLTARKTWEWVVVPLAAGTLQLPSPVFAYFDTASGTYKQLKDEVQAVAVNRGTGTADPGVARGEVQANTKDIAFVKARRGPLREATRPIHTRSWFVILALAPLALIPAGIIWGRRHQRFLSDHGFARARRAARAASRRLDRAGSRAGESSTAFHEEVAGALVDYVADRANRSASGLTYDELEEILGAKGVSPELRRRYRSCLETCDFARYVPDSGRPQAREALVEEARSLIRALEETA